MWTCRKAFSPGDREQAGVWAQVQWVDRCGGENLWMSSVAYFYFLSEIDIPSVKSEAWGGMLEV